MPRLLFGFALAHFFLAEVGSAAVVYDEARHGDLAGEPLQPTLIAVRPGSNVIRGDSHAQPNLDRDFFTIRIAEDELLMKLVLQEFTMSASPLIDDGAFLAVERGATFSDLSGNAMIGATLLGDAPYPLAGDDVLDDLGFVTYWEDGFTPPLGPGDYTFWYQQQTGTTSYALDVVVTPLPPTWVFMGVALAGMFGLARSRKPR